MEFQLSLLQNEIEHVHKNLGLMSEELILMKEFIRQEFSNRFEAFCNARKDKQRHPLPPPIMISNVTTQLQESSSSSVKLPPFVEIKTEPEIDLPELFDDGTFDTSDDNDDNEFEVHPEGRLIGGVDPLQEGRRGVGKPKGRRPQGTIHKYFEHIPAENGKTKTKCYTCHEFVSNQFGRLKKHFDKCSSNNLNSKVVQRLTTIGVKRSNEGGSGAKTGRKLDRVRELFKQVQDSGSGYTKMECLKCGRLVSKQSGRMRNHVEKCEGTFSSDAL